MFIFDKLSTRMEINYMDLFAKVGVYSNSTIPEESRIEKIFTEKEQIFLSCVAAEYLKANLEDITQLTPKSHVYCPACGCNINISREDIFHE